MPNRSALFISRLMCSSILNATGPVGAKCTPNTSKIAEAREKPCDRSGTVASCHGIKLPFNQTLESFVIQSSLPTSSTSVYCHLFSAFFHLTSGLYLLRHPDIVCDIPWNFTADRRQIDCPKRLTGSFIGSVWNPVLKLDMTVSGQHDHHAVI
jgi:hypothetical protein